MKNRLSIRLLEYNHQKLIINMGNCSSVEYEEEFRKYFSMGKQIGSGGYGVVCSASTKKAGKLIGYPATVAVKVITLDTADNTPEEELKKVCTYRKECYMNRKSKV